MSEPSIGRVEGSGKRRRPVQIWALAGVIALEALALIVVTVLLVIDVVTASGDSVVSGIALTLVAAAGAAWLVVMTVHTLEGRPWIRAGAVTVQIMLVALAIGSFQGIFARPDIGWLLLAPALAALILLFTPSVVAATRRT